MTEPAMQPTPDEAELALCSIERRIREASRAWAGWFTDDFTALRGYLASARDSHRQDQARLNAVQAGLDALAFDLRARGDAKREWRSVCALRRALKPLLKERVDADQLF
jgi:hypothetical protein